MKPFQPLEGNRVVWIEAGEYYDELIQRIESAQDSILFETYYCRDGQITRRVFRALAQAAGRGVKVYVMLDALGSAGIRLLATRMLTRQNCQLRFFNPLSLKPFHKNLRRNHRKVCVIDGTCALTGGWGLADTWVGEWKPAGGAGYWLDAGVRVEGPVCGQWVQLFCETWSRTGAAIDHVWPLSPAYEDGVRARVACSQGRAGQELFRSLLARVRKARTRIWIVTPYFVTSKRLRRALKQAARRGLDVCVLVPGPYTDHPAVRLASWRHMRRLIQSGVRIYEYQPSFIHAKVVVIDNWVSTGSCNLDHWTQFLALEANQEVADADFADDVAHRVVRWLEVSSRVTQDPLGGAPKHVRWLARLVAWVERVLYQFWVA